MGGRSDITGRIAGCDLGKCTAKLVAGFMHAGGAVEITSAETVVHDGRPMEVFARWYRRVGASDCAAIGATGLHANELESPPIARLPEEACLESALAAGHGFPSGPLNLLSIGARGYSVLTRDRDGRVTSLRNDKCSSGTGETMVKIAARFGLTIEEADRLAGAAAEVIPITARCSVFAKSEMTHFGNQGRPAEALFAGYFRSVARYAAALLERARVDGPIYLIGGGARLRSLVAALSEAVGTPVEVPQEPLLLEATGALLLAAQASAASLPPDPQALLRPRRARFATLPAPSKHARRVTRLEASPMPEGAAAEPSVLGLDLGSTGSKAVLTSLASGEAVLDLYDRTRGNPVDAAQRLVRALLERVTPDVRAIGLTGSGREAAARVIRAVYPELGDRIVVINEIVAHATAAIRCDEDGGADLSVVEIGGQDAKFVSVVGGQIVSSDMNKACSAGTGSFLEEQSVFYGIEDIERFTEVAQRAENPPDLGQMCTVFVADAAAEAHHGGFSREDIFGGFQYAVITNYLNRVMGQRTFGARIFFQGKPATGPSLAWTLAAVTGREVFVPPNPGAMGAWGIGLCALEALGGAALAEASSFDLRAVLDARVVERAEFQCGDKRCATLCNIERTTVEVGGSRQRVLSGGACPKYEVAATTRSKLPREAPSAFDEREELVRELLEGSKRATGPVVGVPLFGVWMGYAPWLVTLLRELGCRVHPLRSEAATLSRGEARCYAYDACAPVKIAHGLVVDGEVDTVFLPKLLTLGDHHGSCGKTCPMEQGLPEMLRDAAHARGHELHVVSPTLSLERGLRHWRVAHALHGVAGRLGADVKLLAPALRRAAAAQEAFDQHLAEIGRRTLEWGRRRGVPVIAIGGSLHVIHDRAVNADIPRLVRDNGVLALPMDCLPIPSGVQPLPRVLWAEANRALRMALTARARGDVYPLLLTSFGCGPASFYEQVFEDLMSGYPHTVLESDGHGGAAGYITRIQAFLHTVHQHDSRGSGADPKRVGLLDPLPEDQLARERDSRLVLFSIGDGIPRVYAAIYRSLGFDAVAAPPTDAESFRLGRRDCSGKECLPYQMIWGAFRKHLDQAPSDKRQVLMQVAGEGLCRNCMFSIKDRMTLRRTGELGRVDVRHVVMDEPALGSAAMTNLWGGMVGWDILFQLACYLRPLEREPGEIDRLFYSYVDELVARVERRLPPGLGAAVETASVARWVYDLVGRASEAFDTAARPPHAQPDLRSVLLTGDPYLRADEFASDGLIRKLNERGLSVVVEASTGVSEYMAHERLRDVVGLPTGRLQNLGTKGLTRAYRRLLYRRAQRLHPWLYETRIVAALKRANEVLARYPQGVAALAVGTTLHAWESRACDGVVVVSPWGCGPSLVGESLLRHQREIPTLFVYCDGSPLDERRLDAFAFRLKEAPARLSP